MKFRDLHIGDTFDFVSNNRMFNSFFDRCIKVSARKYKSIDNPRNAEFTYTVGTINCSVFHVEKVA